MAGSNGVTEWLTWSFSPTISAILVTLVISLTLPVLLHWYLYKQAATKELPSLLLLGPSGGGKTSLLTLFANGHPSPTHTSQTPATALCQLPSTTRSREDRFRSEHDTTSRSQPKFNLIDTPGHGKLRNHALSSLTSISATKGLIFVIDSAALASTSALTETAEYLYDVLLALQKRHTQAKTSKGPQGLSVLIAANKQDVFTALPGNLVQTKLEQEITKIRQTRSKGLLDSGIGLEDDLGGDDETNWLGEYGSNTFKLSQMEEHGVEVTVVGGNVTSEGNEPSNVQGWWAWIGENL